MVDDHTDGGAVQGAKRRRICKDEIIGLEFPDGRVCWCPRSTMTNATGSYFAARFGNGQVSAGAERPGEHGRTIYFIARDGELFEKYILQFLLTSRPGRLPPFSEDPHLWRALREEAQFYSLDDLHDILYVTYTCEPNPEGQDVLYWVGTDKGKREEYKNPHSTGAVYVGGWVDILSLSEMNQLSTRDHVSLMDGACSDMSRKAFVEHHPRVTGFDESYPMHKEFLYADNACLNMWCGMSFHRYPTVVDLKTINVRLTNYSLRYDNCGMTHWNLEGSVDGTEWDVLHEARNDEHLVRPDFESVVELKDDLKERIAYGVSSEEEGYDVLLKYAEREHRHTWTIDPLTTTFYRYFRIIGIGEEHEGNRCLHGLGLELYGDVHED